MYLHTLHIGWILFLYTYFIFLSISCLGDYWLVISLKLFCNALDHSINVYHVSWTISTSSSNGCPHSFQNMTRPSESVFLCIAGDGQQVFNIYICIYRFVWNHTFSTISLHVFLLTSCSLYDIFLLSWKRLLVRHFSLSSFYFQTEPKSEFSSHKVFFMFCFCITLLLGFFSCYSQYDFDGFFSC